MLSTTGEKYLCGWKEIADHLGKSERTVRRWALTRGLPVERFKGDRTVYALANNLNIWWQSLRVSGVSE